MNKKTRLILSVVGLAAVIVPALLLVFLSKNTAPAPVGTTTQSRSIDAKNVQENAKRALPSPKALPSAASESASVTPSPITEGTSSAPSQ